MNLLNPLFTIYENIFKSQNFLKFLIRTYQSKFRRNSLNNPKLQTKLKNLFGE